MVMMIVYGIGILLFMACPFLLQLIITIINSVTPDPIPILDEVIMGAGMLSKLSTGGHILEFVGDHPLLTLLIIGGLIYLGIQIF